MCSNSRSLAFMLYEITKIIDYTIAVLAELEINAGKDEETQTVRLPN